MYSKWRAGNTGVKLIPTDKGPGFFFVLFAPCGMWDLSFLTKDWTWGSLDWELSLTHWTAREVPGLVILHRRQRQYEVGKRSILGAWDCFERNFISNYSRSVLIEFSCCCSVTQSCLTLCNPMDCSMPGFSVLYYLPEFAQTHVHWVSDAIQPSHPLFPTSPLALNLSQHQGLFQWVSSSHRVAKVLQLQHQSFQWIFRLISYRIDWFGLLAVRGTLKSLQHLSSKASILQHSTFFMVQLSHLYIITRKTIALTVWTFVTKVISLLFNMLSKFVVTFLWRSKDFLCGAF